MPAEPTPAAGEPGGHQRDLRWCVNELQRLIYELNGRLPIYVQVEKVEVQHLEFRFDAIEVDELSGQLNVGLNHVARLTTGQPGAEAEPEPEQREETPGHRLAGSTLPSSVITRWLKKGPPKAKPAQEEHRGVPIWPPGQGGTR